MGSHRAFAQGGIRVQLVFAKSTWEEGRGGLLKSSQRKEMGNTPFTRDQPADEDSRWGGKEERE